MDDGTECLSCNTITSSKWRITRGARTVTVQQVRVWIFSEIAAFSSHLRMRMPYSNCRAEFLMCDACAYVWQLGMHYLWLQVTVLATPRRLLDTQFEKVAAFNQPAMMTLVVVILQLHSFWTWKLNWALSLTPRPLHHRHPLDRCMSRPRNWSGLFQKENFLSLSLFSSPSYLITIKFILKLATTAHRRSGSIALLFLKLGARRRWVVNATPGTLYPRKWPGTYCIG